LLVLFFGIIVTVVVVIVFVKMGKVISKIDTIPNAPIINCTARRQFTQGYCLGLKKRMLLRKNGVYYIEMYPIDSEQSENMPKPELQRFAVAKEMIKFIPSGEASSRREMIMVLPRSNADLPKSMIDTSEGKCMTKEGQLGTLQRMFTDAITGGDDAIFEAMRHFNRGNIAKAVVSQMVETNNMIQKQGQNRNPPVEEKK